MINKFKNYRVTNNNGYYSVIVQSPIKNTSKHTLNNTLTPRSNNQEQPIQIKNELNMDVRNFIKDSGLLSNKKNN